MSSFFDVPPREIPPLDWSLEKQMLSRQKWVELEGGRQTPDPGETGATPDDYLGGVCPDCSGENPPRKPYRDHFDPPLKNIDAETVPPDDLPSEIRHYRRRFMENGAFLSVCDHLTDRELLRWIEDLIKREFAVRGPGGSSIFQLNLSCPDCVRELDDEFSGPVESPPEQLEKKFERIEEKLTAMDDEPVTSEDGIGAPFWSLGGTRLVLLAGSVFERLKTDVETGVIELFDNKQQLLDVLDGLRALEWVLGGLNQLSEETEAQALSTLQGAARMIRIMNNRRTRRHPGRFYSDLEHLLPDVESVCFLVQCGDDADDNPEWPEPSDETPERWCEVFHEEITVENPSFADVLRDGVSERRVEAAHERFVRRNQFLSVQDDKARRILRDFIGRKVQLDPARPGDFLDRDVEPLDPGEVDPEGFSNPELMALVMGGDDAVTEETLGVLEELPDEPPDDGDDLDRELRDDPAHATCRQLLGELKDRWLSGETSLLDRPAVNHLYHLLKFSLDVLGKAYIYRRDLEHRVPVAGAYRFVESRLEDCLKVLAVTALDGEDYNRHLRAGLETLREVR